MTPPDPGADLHDTGRRLASLIAVAFGGLMQLIVGVFVFSSGLIAPAWAVAGLALLWLVATIALWRLRRRPIVALLVPLVTAGLWWAAVTAGDVWLGWTA